MRKIIKRGIWILFFCMLGVLLEPTVRSYVEPAIRQYTKPAEGAAGSPAFVDSLARRTGEVQKEFIIEHIQEQVEVPARYDYREEGRAVPVRNQGQYGTCWAFASLTALETALMPEELMDFSRDHLNYHNGYSLATEEGGSYIMTVAYLTAWQGPVLEEDDPYGDNYSPDGLREVKHVQSVRMPDYKDYDAIKQTVYLHSAVESSLYMDFDNPEADSQFYSRGYASYCYSGQEPPNHDVVIIGWDDAYPAENFQVRPEGDGAFICQNSWGGGFGEEGIFYVSYYDSNIGSYNLAYTEVEAVDNYDRIYQSDLCGWSGQIGYNSDAAYFANVYEADGRQEIRAVGFYATGGDTEYRIAVAPEFHSSDSLQDLKYVQGGYLQYSGYYTIELKEPIVVREGQKFAVAVQISTPEESYPIAVEFEASELAAAIDLSDGEGYISPNGKNWERVEEGQKSNLCLKAYAKER